MESGKGIKNCRGTTSRKRNPRGSSYWPHRLGVSPAIRVDKAAGKEKHQLLQGEIRKGEEKNRTGKMVGLRQGARTRLESTVNRKVRWSDLWRNDVAIKFLIQSVYETLPNPVNLHLWKKTKSPSCPLCEYIGSLKHILSRCQTALQMAPLSSIKRNSGGSMTINTNTPNN